MQEKTFTYYASKGGLFILPLMTVAMAAIFQYVTKDQQGDLSSPVALFTWFFYALALVQVIWGIAWLKAPPVFSGDMDQVTIKNGLLRDPITLRWVDIHTISFRIEVRHTGKSMSKMRFLDFELNSGEFERFRLDLIDAKVSDIHAVISEIAPHIKWVYPD